MLRTRLFRFFGSLVVLLGILSALVGVQVIRKQVINRAQTQVRSDLNSAWSVMNAEMEETETVLRLTADRPGIVESCRRGTWSIDELRNQLEAVRVRYDLDFLSLMAPNGQVVVRGAPPYETGDYYLSERALVEARKGETATTLTLMTGRRLNREHANLADRAFFVREETPRARRSGREVESRGMVMLSAVPVMYRNTVVGVLYGGVLLNRNEELVDRIQKSVFRGEQPKGTTAGTVTIFLHDCRVATTVRHKNGHRALGTLVSKEVADHVLDNGKSWLGKAFVVRDWYLTAYDPIRRLDGEVIGMLYVGILEQPFTLMIREMIMRYALLSLGGVLVTLVLAFMAASHVARPLHALAEAAKKMHRGEKPEAVPARRHCSTETRALIESFNEMAAELTEREEALKEVNSSLSATNRSYMETLGFISHELKTPLGSILNYTYLLSEQKLGDMTDRQKNAVKKIDDSTKRITEMVRHYLNLSRIENGELRPVPTRLAIHEDILDRVLESQAAALEDNAMRVELDVPREVALEADYNMTLEVFENLISNAVKYGEPDGRITIAARPTGTGMVAFTVRNTGAGIAPEDLACLFEKFTRLEQGRSAGRRRGTGLGLFITRHIITAHGGEIRVDSQPGQWTEFSFTLPQYRERNTHGDDDSAADGQELPNRRDMATV